MRAISFVPVWLLMIESGYGFLEPYTSRAKLPNGCIEFFPQAFERVHKGCLFGRDKYLDQSKFKTEILASFDKLHNRLGKRLIEEKDQNLLALLKKSNGGKRGILFD